METNRYRIIFIFSFVIALGLVSFALCVVAEFRKPKKKDIRLDGELCYLPISQAFVLGILALVCLFLAQLFGNFILCNHFCYRNNNNNNDDGGNSSSSSISCKLRNSIIATGFLSFSWISFVLAVVLIGTGTSMSQTQPIGEGWLDGECYIVKDGVFGGSGILVLFTIASTLFSAYVTLRNTKIDLCKKIHAQV